MRPSGAQNRKAGPGNVRFPVKLSLTLMELSATPPGNGALPGQGRRYLASRAALTRAATSGGVAAT